MSGNINSRNMLCIVAVGVVVIAASRLLAGWFVSHSLLYNTSQQAATVAAPSPTPRVVTGKISTPKDGNIYRIYMRPISSRNEVMLETRNGIAVAPVGKYRVTSYRVRCNGKPGCEIMCYPRSSELDIKQGVASALKVATPYTAQISVTSMRGDRVSMSLDIVDRSGNMCRAISRKAPGFQVLTQSGKKVWEGTFTFG